MFVNCSIDNKIKILYISAVVLAKYKNASDVVLLPTANPIKFIWVVCAFFFNMIND